MTDLQLLKVGDTVKIYDGSWGWKIENGEAMGHSCRSIDAKERNFTILEIGVFPSWGGVAGEAKRSFDGSEDYKKFETRNHQPHSYFYNNLKVRNNFTGNIHYTSARYVKVVTPLETPEQKKVRELKATIEKAQREVLELERGM